jgi:glycosyltransferase involved in cell wall biosynthesis
MISIITPTHDARWIYETWQSLKDQTLQMGWEWVVTANHKSGAVQRVKDVADQVKKVVGNDPRVRIEHDFEENEGIGQRKKTAFAHGRGDILVELDHDDILVPTALAELEEAFHSNPDVGFVYSDYADFEDDHEWGVGWKRQARPKGQEQGEPWTYMLPNRRKEWELNDFKFYDSEVAGLRAGRYTCVSAFDPTAYALSLIFFAPHHIRAWRRSVYEQAGRHDKSLKLCDDHDLLIRTYLITRMKRIPRPLYLYRHSGKNTFDKKDNTAEIRRITFELHGKYQDRLVRRQCYLDGTGALDIGGIRGRNSSVSEPGLADWILVDMDPDVLDMGGLQANLRKRWGIKDETVGAIRAYDVFQLFPDKFHLMNEISRVLVPGGWVLSLTPSTDGRGAFQDPSHVSYWNENAFKYWTHQAYANYLPKKEFVSETKEGGEDYRNYVKLEHPRFQVVNLSTVYPSEHHRETLNSWVRADLIALKGGYRGPGPKHI